MLEHRYWQFLEWLLLPSFHSLSALGAAAVAVAIAAIAFVVFSFPLGLLPAPCRTEDAQVPLLHS